MGRLPPPSGRRRSSNEVKLDLDGVTHLATARWPDDEDPEISPAVPLRFRPSLPGLP